MSQAVKRQGCFNLKTLIETQQLIFYDKRILEELSNFVLRGKSYEAEDGNDDLVMSMVIFSWAAKQDYFRELHNTDLMLELYEERAKQLEEETLPFILPTEEESPQYVMDAR